MNFRKTVSLIAAALVFLFSTFASWYEGGQLRDISWEWKHTALFSHWFNGKVNSASDISELDHFIYAAKFEPFFPFLMAASLFFIIFQLALWLLKNRTMLRTIFFWFMAVCFFAAGGILLDSPTTGLKLFAAFFGIMGIVSLSSAFLYKKTKSSHQIN